MTAPPGNERTLLLAKPDAVARGLVGEAASACEAAGLRVECRHPVTLDEREVAALWGYAGVGTELSRRLVEGYVGGRPAAVLRLAGPGALAAATRVKSGLRARYGDYPAANVCHTPDSLPELHWQAPAFTAGCAGCRAAFPSPGARWRRAGAPRLDPDRYGSLLAAAGPDLLRVAFDMGRRSHTAVRELPPLVRLDGGGPWTLRLWPSPGHNAESAVTELSEQLPAVAPATLLEFLLRIGSHGAPLASGPRPDVAALAARLEGRGLVVAVAEDGRRWIRDAVYDAGRRAAADAGVAGEALASVGTLLFGPEAVASRGVRPGLAWLAARGLEAVAATTVAVDRATILEWRRYQASDHFRENLWLVEQSWACGPSVLVAVRGAPGTPARLAELRGSASPAARAPESLRSFLGTANPELNYVHTPADEDELLRELAVLCPEPARSPLLAAAARGAPDGSVARAVAEAERGLPRCDLSLAGAVDRMARRRPERGWDGDDARWSPSDWLDALADLGCEPGSQAHWDWMVLASRRLRWAADA